ncbi:MAG TPA: hypothetical protein VMT63_12530 [Bacteroidales bacterium]|nr:hypothetical protein [Bacteroidales bacterium]
METHAQELHKSPGHGWRHYVFEFLMLFLAVFCGFLAENIRERLEEHHKEKEYMYSMIEDLKADTIEYNRCISLISETIIPFQQKSLSLVFLNHYSESDIKLLYENIPVSLESITLFLHDRTLQQLKNSGNLRLIRSKVVMDSLAAYWSQCDKLSGYLFPSYENARKEAKDIYFSLFSLDNYIDYKAWMPIKANTKLNLLSGDKLPFIKLGNYISNIETQLSVPVLSNLSSAKKMAENLVILLKKEYK